VIDDDFASIVDKLKAADAVVFATPVYWSDLSESLKAFMDRLRRIRWQENSRQITQGKRAVGICVAGGGGGGAPTCCVNLERTLGHMGFDLVDMIAARRQNLPMKLKVCEIAGKWLAEG
jgi:multimeric flavodoxin WrbA